MKSEKINCPVCDSPLIEQLHDRVWSAPDMRVFRCQECLSGFLDPMMTPDQEKEFYASYNEHTKKRGVTLTNDPKEFHAKSRPEAKLRWERLKGYFKDGSRVLEVGASTGAFLEICSETCQCVCVEPDSANREFASQFSISAYDYLEIVDGSEKFDIICLFHVFEHIRKPLSFLDRCFELLNENGLIIIEVPHMEDPLISLYDLQAYKDFYFQPMHHYIYSETGLKKVFEGAGFSEKDIIYIQRYGLDNHLGWLKHGKPGGEPLLRTFFAEADRAYRRDLEKAGKTDTIMYIAAKKPEQP